jgi:MFS family permease
LFLLLLVKNIFKDGMTLYFETPVSVSSDMIVVGFYIFYNIIYAVASYPAGALADKYGAKKMFISGLVCFALAYGGMAFTATGWISQGAEFAFVLACFVVYGFYAACTDGVSKAWVSALCKKEDKGLALGLFSGLQSFATLGASLAAGLVWTFINPATVFFSSAVVSVIVIFYITFGLKSAKNIVPFN